MPSHDDMFPSNDLEDLTVEEKSEKISPRAKHSSTVNITIGADKLKALSQKGSARRMMKKDSTNNTPHLKSKNQANIND